MSRSGEEHQARFDEVVWRTFWMMMIVVVKVCCLYPNHNILRPRIDGRFQL